MATPKAISQLIEGSGNNFHAKVARWLNANGWHTVVSPYYMDQAQSKARELDLVAEKLWPIHDAFGRQNGNVLVRLFVECKYVAADAVFWFAPKDRKAATDLVCSFHPFIPNNTYTFKHHYLASCPKVAKLFASSNAKAQENEPFYKALNQVLNATIALKSQAPSHPDLAGWEHGKLVVLEYPLVVCSSFSQMYSVDFLAESEPSEITENFQMEVQYAFLDRNGRQHNDYFLLDFVEFNQLAGYEAHIAEGAQAAAVLSSYD